jgi:hypothetical protein
MNLSRRMKAKMAAMKVRDTCWSSRSGEAYAYGTICSMVSPSKAPQEKENRT